MNLADGGSGLRVRPYAMTGGRTRSATEVAIEAIVYRTPRGDAVAGSLSFERGQILALVTAPQSAAEISAHLHLPLGVARVLVGDLVDEGFLALNTRSATGRPDLRLLEGCSMASEPSDMVVTDDLGPGSASAPMPVKIVVAGGFAVGKTRFVGSISEIEPLTTEAALTRVSEGVDDTSKVSTKTTTTVAMDFGRLTLGEDLILYLFGTPGQDRFWFMWDDLVRGAIGAVVLIDTRRLEDCFPAVDYFEEHQIPFVVGMNCFDGEMTHDPDDVREALAVSPDTPVLTLDARERESTRNALLELVQHALVRATA